MGVKTAGVGHFQIPTAPAAGTSVTSGAANAYTTTPVQLIASTTAALFITGVHLESSAALAATYISVQLMVGGSGAETVIGQYLVPLGTGSTVALGFHAIYPPVPVAASARISAKTADSVGAKATLVTLECIAQTNVVDMGVNQSTNVVQWNGTNVAAPATAGIPEVNVKNINNAAAATPGAAGGLMISGSNAGTTTLGALTITGATTHTGATIHTGNVSMAAGLTITQSTTNGAGVSITGNGTGNGLDCIGGATSGDGMGATGGGSGNGIHAAAGATGKGIGITTTAGDGLSITPTGGSAIVATGNGTNKHGIVATGGTAGVSDGMTLVAGTGGVDFRANQTGNLTGNISGSVGSVTGAVGSVTGAVGSVTGAVGSVTGAVGSVTGAVGSVTGNVGGNVVGSVASVTGAVGSVTGLTASDVGAIKTTIGVAGAGLTAIGDTRMANLDAAISTRSTLAAGAAMTLTGPYDAAKTAATQASVNLIPTTPLLAANYTVPPTAAAIRAEIDATSAGLAAIYARTDVATSSRLATTSYTAPDNASITAIKGKTDNLPLAPAATGDVTAVGSDVTAIKAKTDSLTFTRLGELDVNVQSINDKPLSGTGAPGDLFVV